MTPAAAESIRIDGPASLEAVVEEPVGVGGGHAAPYDRYAVLCHPHPLHGGTMENKVVTTLARAMHDCGIPTLRFNFRGVGKSTGTFDAGAGETDDAAAAAAWGASHWPGRRLVLAGFSFGAYVALRLAQVRRPAQLITVAPPLALFDFAVMQVPACPWLIVQGAADDVVEPQSVMDWVEGLHPRPQLVVMPGVGHFFHGRLQELRAAVTDALRGESRPGT